MGNAFDLRRHLPSAAFVLMFLLLIAGFIGVFVYLGIYNVGADAPHSRLVYTALDELRERAIASHSRNIVPPNDLASSKRIQAGAGLYAEMCTGCHLGPGIQKSELSQGLYPQAPELARVTDLTAAQQFWIIKHGVKLTAMPAWGRTHSDDLIWDMVAFLRTLPKLSPDQYKALVASAPEDHEEMMEEMAGTNRTHPAKPRLAHDHLQPHEHSN
jgi:mono/diheme cytochrome c family protein